MGMTFLFYCNQTCETVSSVKTYQRQEQAI